MLGWRFALPTQVRTHCHLFVFPIDLLHDLLQLLWRCAGTSEMHFVSAIDSVSANTAGIKGGLRAVLGLHETVCSGAADGYARMARRPALTLLHLGPGLANGLANLHNARRAGTPVVNLVGEQQRPGSAAAHADCLCLCN